jgi:hypothetical protein
VSDLKKTDADLVLGVTPETVAQLGERPLLAVPPELRKPVFQVWAMFRHLTGLETPGPIAFAVGLWVSEHGISPEVIRKALSRMTAPTVMRNIRFASDLTATLAEMCSPGRVYDHIPGVSCE